MYRILKAVYNRTVRHKEYAKRMASLDVVDVDLTVRAKHPGASLIAIELVKFFRDVGASNYATLTVVDPSDMEAYDVIVQKRSRPDMAAVNSRLRTALEDIADSPQSAKAIANKVLRECGYRK